MMRDLRPAWLSPMPRAGSGVESLLVLVAGFVIAFPRGGGEVFRGTVWAEDGAVFLQQAYEHGAWSMLLHPYAGYGHVVPRLVTGFVDLFPVTWHGLMMALAATLVQALIGLFAFHVVRSHCRGKVAPLVAALAVAAVPVGAEVSANVANLQWFLLFGACLAALWQPRTAVGRAGSLAVLAGCALSCPFGGVAVATAVVVWWLLRRRDLLVLAVVGVVAEVVQLVVIATAPPRTTAGHPWWKPLDMAASYLRRVVGDGVLGTGRHAWDDPARSLVPGLVVVAALLVLGLVARRLGGTDVTAFAAVLLTLSVVTFVIPVGLTGINSGLPFWVAGPGRYYVTPALLVLVAAAVMVERVLLPDGADLARAGHAASWRAPVWSRILAWSVLAAIAFGLVTSYREPTQFRRDRTPSWSSQVSHARAVCRAQPTLQQAGVSILPKGWVAVLPCDRLTSR